MPSRYDAAEPDYPQARAWRDGPTCEPHYDYDYDMDERAAWAGEDR